MARTPPRKRWRHCTVGSSPPRTSAPPGRCRRCTGRRRRCTPAFPPCTPRTRYRSVSRPRPCMGRTQSPGRNCPPRSGCPTCRRTLRPCTLARSCQCTSDTQSHRSPPSCIRHRIRPCTTRRLHSFRPCTRTRLRRRPASHPRMAHTQRRTLSRSRTGRSSRRYIGSRWGTRSPRHIGHNPSRLLCRAGPARRSPSTPGRSGALSHTGSNPRRRTMCRSRSPLPRRSRRPRPVRSPGALSRRALRRPKQLGRRPWWDHRCPRGPARRPPPVHCR